MVSVSLDRPAWALIGGVSASDPELVRLTSYTDRSAAYELLRFTKNPWSKQQLSAEEYAAKHARLTAAVKRSLLVVSDVGELWIPSGLASPVASALGVTVEGDERHRLPLRVRPWHRRSPKIPRDYQLQAAERLLAARHGAVALPPGTGKTLVIQELLRETGLSAVVFSPSRSIVSQTHRELVETLGPRVVGLYGGGKKDLERPVTVATTQSLLRVAGRAADFFRAKRLMAGDESHTLPAEAMRAICLDLLGDVPYRFFLSGSQDRHDGLRPMLDGVIGPIVLEMTVEEAVRRGALVPQRTRMIEIRHGSPPRSKDPGKATRQVLFASRRINEVIGGLVNQMVDLGRPALVLVDELPQFACLLPFLRHPVRFAHGCEDRERLEEAVPPAYREADPLALADQFNEGAFPILVGTACLGTGVDLRATGAGFYLRGGKSENDMRQACGRFQRLHPGKSDVWVFDVDVTDGDIVHRHAEERLRIWRRIYPDVDRVSL